MANCYICGCSTGGRWRSHATPEGCDNALATAIGQAKNVVDMLRERRDMLRSAKPGDSIEVIQNRRTGATESVRVIAGR